MSFKLPRVAVPGLVVTVVVALTFAVTSVQVPSTAASANPVGSPAVSSMSMVHGQVAVPAPAPTGRVLVGSFSGPNFPADIDSYTSEAGSKPDLVHWFQSWDEPLYYSSQRAGIEARDVTPIISWFPASGFTPARLLAGKYDNYLIAQAKLAKAWPRPIMIRPFHEMNGNWNNYGYGKASSAAFVAGWHRVVNIFRAQGATNVLWVWSPNIYGFGNTVGFDRFYPGDGHVDWVGLDGYNFDGYWQSFSTLFSRSYADITALTAKPLMVAEWGCTETGGSKADWIRDAFAQLPTKMPRIRAMVTFNYVAESDFRINSSATSQSAYRAAIATLGR